MICVRCGGLMVVEPFYDATELTISEEPQEARCLNCGNVEDAVIYANRLEPRLARNAAHNKIGGKAESSCGKAGQFR
jgi:hypothetical protein